MSVLSKLNDCVEKKGAGFIVLIDPDKKNDKNIDQLVEKANQNGVDAIFVDEIQDLTELQVAMLLQNLDNNGHRKFEVAGDTSQSVHPSAFRWEDLRRAVGEILEIKLPKHHKMNTNYRATPYLIKSANLFLEEHDKILGINSDESVEFPVLVYTLEKMRCQFDTADLFCLQHLPKTT